MFILPQTTWKLKAQEDQMANELRYKGSIDCLAF
jgi:hypothetical protein